MSHFPVLCVILVLQHEDIGSTRSCHSDFVVFHNTFVLSLLCRGLHVIQSSEEKDC